MSTETQTPENTAGCMAALGALQEGESCRCNRSCGSCRTTDRYLAVHMQQVAVKMRLPVYGLSAVQVKLLNGKTLLNTLRPVLQMLLNQPLKQLAVQVSLM